jgi:murein DD-endopeptidase MepM/ murein hydrolase activator NlpD
MPIDFKKIRKQIRTHLEKSFLFVIRDEDTFEEIGSYKLSLLNVYILLSTILCISGLLMLLLIIFTPIKNIIPGYGDISYSSDYKNLIKKVQNIENELIARENYINGLRRMLSGQPEGIKDVTKDVHFKIETPEPVKKISEDSMLRTAFESKVDANRQESRNKSRKSENINPLNSKKSLDEINFICPLRGPIGAAFKPEKDHYGVDIIGPENSPIKAVLGGSVIQSDWSMENGHTIAIQHSDNLVSVYKHNSTLFKKLGTQIKAGEVIAIIGNTGTLTQGPHLHFELWHQGRCINPTDYIRFN